LPGHPGLRLNAKTLNPILPPFPLPIKSCFFSLEDVKAIHEDSLQDPILRSALVTCLAALASLSQLDLSPHHSPRATCDMLGACMELAVERAAVRAVAAHTPEGLPEPLPVYCARQLTSLLEGLKQGGSSRPHLPLPCFAVSSDMNDQLGPCLSKSS